MAKKEDSKNIKEESKKEVEPEIIEETKIVEDEEENKQKNNGLIIKIVIAVIVLFLLLLGGKFIFDNLKDNDSISGVRRLLKPKYADVRCIDLDCNGFIIIDGDQTKKYKVILYDVTGKKVANYKVNYDSENKTTEVPIKIWGNQYISTTVNTSKTDILKYSIRNKKGKVVFETENELRVLNDKFVLMKEDGKKSGDSLKLIDKKGKTIYSGIQEIETYSDGEYIEFEMNDTYVILDSKGNKILDGYTISKIVENEDKKPVYAIVRNVKDKVYNYYDLDKKQIVGDNFVSYDKLDEEEMTYKIVKKENDKRVNYILYKNGKQKKDEEDLNIIKDKIEESLNKEQYTLHENSVYKKDQKEVLVDNKTNKSFGVLNLKDKKYTKIYDYKKDRSYISSTVSKIDSENGAYLKVSCSKYNCETAKSMIYNLDDKKVIYTAEETSSISSYAEYEDGYKVIKLYSSSSNVKYDSKTIVLDKNNKEIYKSDNYVIIIDKELEVGKKSTYSTMLYSVKKDKVLNSGKASSITVADKTLYKYTDDNDNIIILNDKGEEILKATDDSYLKKSGDSYICLDDNLITIYNVDKDKSYKYKLKENEKMNDGSGNMISAYRNSMFINNSTDKYIKVINFKGKTLKKINNVEITDVEINADEKKAFIIVKKNTKKGDQYGLYVAE